MIEECLTEPLVPGGTDLFRDVPLSHLAPLHVRMLRERKTKAGLKGAANNRRKYLSAMFGWAIEADPPLMQTNPARDVKRVQYATDGFHTWTMEEVRQFEARHPVGTKARLALGLILFLGVRRSDVVRLGRQHLRGSHICFVPQKTRGVRPEAVEKPVLPVLAKLIAASPCGDLTFLVNDYGRPFAAAGFGNKFRDWCNEAGLPHCSAHGLRKAASCLLADHGATSAQMMAIFDWATPGQAEPYIRRANKKRQAGMGMPLLAEGYSVNTELPHRPEGDCPTPEKSKG